ncbi:hypothetical protein RvY_12084 [Ramazzottius varieornatus]|uniref:beta-glucosidase n=1 Tax=Ramazzottius varieornatus TaxID=947166 RepID=A0A1D1VIC0_RAMVA|nr:hypothetical protein RvY_12084 [Ramazzottius varieornatus]
MRSLIYLTLSCTLLSTCVFGYPHGQKNPKLSPAEIEEEISRLINDMILPEKLGQLQQLAGDWYGEVGPSDIPLVKQGLVGSILNVHGAARTNQIQRWALESRQKIPVLIGFDVIHGFRTLFPIPLGETASWDLEAVEQAAAIAAAEARSVGIHWTFAPMVDVMRDPRWGRVMEGSGEDVFLGSEMAKARVRGFQGGDYSAHDRVLACAKHFAAYGAAEAGRDYNGVDMSERRLREIYLPPFKAAVDAGVGSFMTAFNDLNGVPATGNKFLLTKVLRDEWKFDGLVVSDWDAVLELINHQYATNQSEAAMYALNAGTDMEMASRTYVTHGEQLIRSGKVSIETVNTAVRNILRIKYRMGLFDNPFIDENLESATLFKQEFLDAARNITARTFVLLKNQGNILPISKSIGKLAVIGGLAADKFETTDHWPGDVQWQDSVTMLQGIMTKLGVTDTNGQVTYAEGCDTYCRNTSVFDRAEQVARQADFVVVVVGEPREYSGEAGSMTNIGLPGYHLDLVKRIHSTGKPYAVVLVNGRPMTIEWLAENAPAILVTWRSGSMGGHAVADVLFGDVNPSGKLPMSFPRNVGQIPVHYDHKNTGRPIDKASGSLTERYRSKYIDSLNSPQYPFGYGLSYTRFAFENLQLNTTSITAEQSVQVGVSVRNTGQRDGEEVVQVYVRDVAASITRPVRQLKAFKKVKVAVGQTVRIELILKPEDLGFLDDNWQWKIEPGVFEIYVGNNSDTTMQANLTVTTAASEVIGTSTATAVPVTSSTTVNIGESSTHGAASSIQFSVPLIAIFLLLVF